MIDKLIEHFYARFSDYIGFKAQLKLFGNPTNIGVEETDIKDQMELQASEFDKLKKETGADLFKMFLKEKNLNLRDLGLTLILMFWSTYICE